MPLILILSDVNMPGMSGLELLPKVKASRPDVPVIMITAYGDGNTRRIALEGGAEALLTKPIDFTALRSEIGSFKSQQPTTVADGSKPEVAALRRDACFRPVSGPRRTDYSGPKS
jgi:CheY-like chemotaxis protein